MIKIFYPIIYDYKIIKPQNKKRSVSLNIRSVSLNIRSVSLNDCSVSMNDFI